MKQYESLYKKVYKTIRENIITNKYAPGEPILEELLVNEMGVSRTPIREALRLLEKENLVKIYPRRGAFINSISLDSIREIFEIREILEGEIALQVASSISIRELEKIEKNLKLIKQKLKDKDKSYEATLSKALQGGQELHRLIFVTFGNKKLLRIIDSLEEERERGCNAATHRERKNVLKFLEQHLEIIKALKERNGVKAKQIMQKHISDAKKAIL